MTRASAGKAGDAASCPVSQLCAHGHGTVESVSTEQNPGLPPDPEDTTPFTKLSVPA